MIRAVSFDLANTLVRGGDALDGAAEALAALAQGRRLAVIANTGPNLDGHAARLLLRRLDLARHFEDLRFSDETGLVKPDPEAWWAWLRPLNVEYGEAVHVGDGTIVDVRGAKQAGLRAVLFTGGMPGSARPAGADAACRHLRDLPGIIAGL